MTSRDAFSGAADVLAAGAAERLFPAAVAEVGDSANRHWIAAFGALTFEEHAPPATPATIFDLASLTKVIATTSVILDLLAQGVLTLDTRLSEAFAEWRGADRAETTVRDCLEHCTGLPARLVDPPPATRREFEHDICAMPLEYPRRTRALYSDLDFILLGFLAGDRGRRPLDAQFDVIRNRLFTGASGEPGYLAYGVPAALHSTTAPTQPLEFDYRTPRRLVGEVQDTYAAALGGVAGHAGLFGTAGSVGRFARLALGAARGDASVPAPLTSHAMALARQRSHVPGSSRALGWDTMLVTSSCGTAMSPSAFGHVGFSGTSLWIDPDRDRYFVLLTNRVCGGGTTEDMQRVRRAFHDALAAV